MYILVDFEYYPCVLISVNVISICVISFDPDLVISKEEQDLVTCSHITTSLTECLKSLQEATHHYAVKVKFNQTCTVDVVCQLMVKFARDYAV